MDTFDLKPDAPAEFRGEFNPIKTNVPGIEISEHLPKLAQCADKFAILRGVTHTLGAHELGTEYVNTGNRPIPSLEYPGYGAVVTKELGGPQDLPPFVAIPNSNQRPGFLGVQYAPLNTTSTPKAGQPFSVRGISLGNGLTVEEVERRNSLLADLDKTFAGRRSEQPAPRRPRPVHRAGPRDHHQPAGPRGVRRQPGIARVRQAVRRDAVRHELPARHAADRVGRAVRHGHARRLGHAPAATGRGSRRDLLPELDAGLSALLNGLAEKGLLDTTTVFVTGEFGRTPKINTRDAEGGRDHYPRCMFMLMAGGGVQGGQVIGERDETASAPKNDGFSPDDVAASFYHTLGIDHTKEYHTNTGRPIMIVRDGHVIEKLLS